MDSWVYGFMGLGLAVYGPPFMVYGLRFTGLGFSVQCAAAGTEARLGSGIYRLGFSVQGAGFGSLGRWWPHCESAGRCRTH